MIASSEAADRELADQRGRRAEHRGPVVAGRRDAEREEQREPDARVVEELERRGPLDQREMPRRVLEDHRLVDHRQLEVRRRVVDRNPRVLGQRHHRERDAGEGEARIDRQLAVRERVDDRRQRRRAGDQRCGEQHHQQRRLGEEADEHLAPRAERAERGADVHRGERDEHAGQREQPDQRDRVGGARERQVGGERRHDRRRAAHRAEDDVRRDAEDRRGVLGDHRVLREQLADRPVRQEQRRRALVLQPGAALVDPADQQRRQRAARSRLQQLGAKAARANDPTLAAIAAALPEGAITPWDGRRRSSDETSNASSVQKLYVR